MNNTVLPCRETEPRPRESSSPGHDAAEILCPENKSTRCHRQ